ncbi:MAG: HIT family protein [Planctomycetota bacterium]|nr:HIT family protein [Planctomycetota bacterium]
MHDSVPAHDPSCLFCRILAGEIASSRVLETPDAVAILDIQPVNFGHVLLVPRLHHADLAELPDDVAARVATLLPRLARAIQAACKADGLNVVINNGRAAGQTVFHGHWHLVPRFVGDAVRWPWPQGRYEGDTMAVTQAAILSQLTSK